jgi:hypothetical protein
MSFWRLDFLVPLFFFSCSILVERMGGFGYGCGLGRYTKGLEKACMGVLGAHVTRMIIPFGSWL